ncbi:MAG TPA: hypothetical protein VE422_44580 [Terriglobia bacterium]|nr:hypothetical protein [Terriglobia bacterium]
MQRNTILRRGPALALVLAWMAAASTLIHSQTETKGPIERITGTTVNVTGAGDPFKIDLLRWSTDAEREQLLASLVKSEKDLASALEKAPTLGYVWTSESAGYSIRYAHHLMTPDGSERMIVATDRPLGSWDPRIWKAPGSSGSTPYPFTVIELRFNRQGTGEGKASVLAKVVPDNAAKTIALDNYAGAPVVLKTVKREGGGGARKAPSK